MRLKRFLCIGLLFILSHILIGCMNSDGDKALIISSELIASEKTLPDHFFDLAEQGVIVNEVTNLNDFQEQWDHFGLTGDPKEVEWDNKVVFFLGIGESGTCPLEFKAVELNVDKTEMIIHLTIQSENGACTDDHTPRTMVIAVNADEVSDVSHIEVKIRN